MLSTSLAVKFSAKIFVLRLRRRRLTAFRWKRGVADVLVFSQQASIECEQFLLGTGARGSDTRIGRLLAHDGFSLAGDDVSMLDVDIVAAFGLSAVLVGGYAGHNSLGSERDLAGRPRLLCRRLKSRQGKRENSDEVTHISDTSHRIEKFPALWRTRERCEPAW